MKLTKRSAFATGVKSAIVSAITSGKEKPSMEEHVKTIRVEGKEDFLKDLSEEKEAALELKAVIDATTESVQRLNEQLDKLKNR